MLGFITSPRAARALDFLRRVGPVPFPAMVVALGCRPGQLAKALRHLRGGGYAAPVRLNGTEYWVADGTGFNLDTQETLAWFAARLEEAGGRYEAGTARFPRGQTYRVVARGERAEVGECVCFVAELKEKPLRECLRRRVRKNFSGGV
ncbi:MAG: hypothetical protein ACUVRF_00005 [Desulfotomaculales bacterium]